MENMDYTQNTEIKEKRKKCKGLRRLRRLAMLPLLLHFGSKILKAGWIPGLNDVYEWYMTHIYEGLAGILIQPVSQMVWGLDCYPQIYFWTGIPLALFVFLLSRIISLKEKSMNCEGSVRSWYDLFEGGRYDKIRPSLYRRISSFLKLRFFAEQNNLSDESSRAFVLTVLYGEEEQTVNIGQLQEWEWKTAGLRMNFDQKSKRVRVSFDKDAQVCLLKKGEEVSHGLVYVTYLK